MLDKFGEIGYFAWLRSELLEEVVRWSVGSCWVTDNYKKYQPDAGILKKMAAIETNLKLMTTKRILSISKWNILNY